MEKPYEIKFEGFKDKGASRLTGNTAFADELNASIMGKKITKVMLSDSNISESNMKALELAFKDNKVRLEELKIENFYCNGRTIASDVTDKALSIVIEAMAIGDIKKKNVENGACKAIYFMPRKIQREIPYTIDALRRFIQ